jgi:uncharacterized protein (TIGR01777 family)
MHVVIAGGTGYLGGVLKRHLHQGGHRVSLLTRDAGDGPDQVQWTPDGDAGPWVGALTGVDAIVNLAGAGLPDKRWSAARKRLLIESRRQATSSLVKAVQALPSPPRVFVSGSGVGIYGPRGDEPIGEDTPPGADFVARMAAEWEAAAAPAVAVTRVVWLRTGLVLGHGGALAQMLPPFRFGVGGRLGSGRQWMPWIHEDDWAALTRRLVEDEAARGPFNMTAPHPVTNAEFTKTLGRVLGRPTVVPVPAVALRVLFGELADVLLTGQRAVPAKAQALGYAFRFAGLEPALRHLLADHGR